MNLEARVLFLLLHTYSTVTQPQKKRKKNRQKIIAGTAAAALELLYLSQSQKVEQPKKSFVFLFNFFI